MNRGKKNDSNMKPPKPRAPGAGESLREGGGGQPETTVWLHSDLWGPEPDIQHGTEHKGQDQGGRRVRGGGAAGRGPKQADPVVGGGAGGGMSRRGPRPRRST